MAELCGSITEKNLLKAFAGESQARNRYTYFAAKAKEEGYVQVSMIFEETADHERLHAKRFFKFLEGGNLEITSTYPAGPAGTTEENLQEAALGEKFEWSTLYPQFAETARKEGFNDIAAAFSKISNAERHHEERYLALLENVKNGTVLKKDGPVTWTCIKCGYTHYGEEPPAKCQACLHDAKYFIIKSESY